MSNITEALEAYRSGQPVLLRRLLTERLNFSDVSVLWYDTLGSRIENDCPQANHKVAVIELIEQVRMRGLLPQFVDRLLYLHPYLWELPSLLPINERWSVAIGKVEPSIHKGIILRSVVYHEFGDHDYGAIVVSSSLDSDFRMTGRCELSRSSLFGIIYNWESIYNFQIIRIDKRPNPNGEPDNGLFVVNGLPNIGSPERFKNNPTYDQMEHSFEVVFKKPDEMHVYFDANELHLQGRNHKLDQWNYDPSKRVGFWVEQGTCLLHDVDVQPV